ncbi:hypothetical protein P5673_003764 [Acropora cervicornis]|uniref:Uncharacterized protein n=1 Tax=Acropora cervicornis TaxID=6130 RepID=A0AAD9R134_ACRCE|nr:hypothetical protein P5673_003764 [Acropora cervicornis]
MEQAWHTCAKFGKTCEIVKGQPEHTRFSFQPAAVAMERENNAESKRKWREKKRNRPQRKNIVRKTRSCRSEAATATAKTSSTERVRKLHKKKAAEKEEEEQRKQLSKERSKRYHDKK